MNRDLSITKFSFKSFRNLKKGLGEFDAVVECNELAIREFLKNLNKSPNQDTYIQELSENHNVRVDTVLVKLFAPRIRQFYIMSVMQKSEQFFDEFKTEYKSYGNTWINKIDGETEFDNLLKNVFGTKAKGITEIGEEVYNGFEYYRLVRNRFAHSEEKNDKKLNGYYEKAEKYKTFYNINFHCVAVPNGYKKINFDDFLLFTNIIKNIGYTLCEKCKPDNQKLAEIISKHEIEISETKSINAVKSLLKIKNKEPRFTNSIGNLLNTNFGRINEKDRDEIISHLLSILA
jgi:hypothetical protein